MEPDHQFRQIKDKVMIDFNNRHVARGALQNLLDYHREEAAHHRKKATYHRREAAKCKALHHAVSRVMRPPRVVPPQVVPPQA
jgi:hypothetical protein